MRRAMVLAPTILFGVSLAVLVLGFVVALLLSQNMNLGTGQTMTREVLLSALLTAIQAATWPFFGAALLYRIDRWMVASLSGGGND